MKEVRNWRQAYQGFGLGHYFGFVDVGDCGEGELMGDILGGVGLEVAVESFFDYS